MKISYKGLLNVVDEIGEEMTNQGRSYSTHFLKEAVWNFYAFLFLVYTSSVSIYKIITDFLKVIFKHFQL